MKLARPEYRTVRYIVENMREWDRREIFATQWDEDPDRFTKYVMATADFAWVAGLDLPIAAIGAFPVWPGVWSVWMFATDNFRQIGKSLTKHAKKVMIPAILEGEFHRAHCYSMAGHTVAHRWLEALGACHEATLQGFGRGGEDFLVFAWDRAAGERARWKGAR
jgi:hypothetical protein